MFQKKLQSKQKTLLLAILLIPFSLAAQKHTVSGYVLDSASHETLIGATVYDTLSGIGTVSNQHGFYTLVLPEGQAVLRYSFAGYPHTYVTVDVMQDTSINVAFQEQMLEEVTVVAKSSATDVGSTQMSANYVPIAVVKKIPSMAGELDIIKAIQLLPGVQSGSEGSTGLYVRGGGPDENLILLDGIPLYNINHAMGMFSVFNADAIKSFTLYKGNFPARFGGRLSSVLDVRQKDGNAQSYHGTVSVGLLAAKVSVEGPIWKEHTTFNVSFRRSYFDILAQPIIAAYTASEGTPATGGYYFYDINARISHKFSDKDRLSASFFMDDDGIYASFKDKYEYAGSREEDKMRADWRWGNIVGSLNWLHVYTPKIFSEMTVAYSQYQYVLKMNESTDEKGIKSEFDMGFKSRISDVTFKYDFDYKPHHAHNMKFGAEYVYHYFKPSIMSAYNIEADVVNYNMDTTFGNKPIHNHEAALYFEDDWSIHERFKLNLGLRGSLYCTKSKVYPNIEPRAGLRILMTNDFSFKASYSYMTQYVHLLSSSNVTLPTDLWVPVTDNIPPMKCHQVAGGFFYNVLGYFDISIEGYYKKMANVLEYKDGATYVSINGDWEDKVCVGDGYSYGIEVLLQRSVGKFTGWIGYTWSRSIRKFNREGMMINEGKEFPAKYDRQHDLSISLQYSPVKLVDLGLTFIYGTGTCGSLALQQSPDGMPLLTTRNNFRMPDYHRMDFSANFHFDRKPKKDGTPRKGEHQLNINIYNLYNHKNAYMVYVDNGKLMQLSIFPILPSIGYTFKF